MKQPTPLWQVISICVTVLIASFTGIMAQSNKIAKLEQRMDERTLQFERMAQKVDQIQFDIRAILITLQDKQDRPR